MEKWTLKYARRIKTAEKVTVYKTSVAGKGANSSGAGSGPWTLITGNGLYRGLLPLAFKFFLQRAVSASAFSNSLAGIGGMTFW